ncbi:MAG: 4-alpha-glucanotransferase [Desulfobacteraceae bacterium]|nr:MAG: 4-alpha-glucanotransferase [Desulfobacteraceae bacterium]
MMVRSSGILLHPSSLPGPFGIGDLGPDAYRFIDFLSQGGQHLWQLLPVTPTEAGAGHSPYHSTSTFAGNPLLISPLLLQEQGWLQSQDLKRAPTFAPETVDYAAAHRLKLRLLQRAFARFQINPPADELRAFENTHAWLEDYALFAALNDHYRGRQWNDWPIALRDRKPEALKEAARTFAQRILYFKMAQFFFFRQWDGLRDYGRRKAVQLIGDMPIYMPLHSADVWSHQELFNLTAAGKPSAVSGVPPDYFSRSGQLWGHPLYRWDVLRRDGYAWWIERVLHHLKLFDRIRVDHFRGLVAYWEVPAGARTAINGHWVPGPAADLLTRLSFRMTQLPLIAEDLGTIDADVRETMQRFDLPGMRVLLFAFGGDFPKGSFLPHNHVPNCLAYTGTHDNNTALGWFEEEAGASERRRLFSYLGRQVPAGEIPWELIRLAMQSVARTVIIPLQDVLALGGGARMNRPASRRGNWRWRAQAKDFSADTAARLLEMAVTYGRA